MAGDIQKAKPITAGFEDAGNLLADCLGGEGRQEKREWTPERVSDGRAMLKADLFRTYTNDEIPIEFESALDEIGRQWGVIERLTGEVEIQEGRVFHVHDSANALFVAAGAVIAAIRQEMGNDTTPWPPEMIDLVIALNDDQAKAALAEVQRRDRLDEEVAKLTETVRCLGQQYRDRQAELEGQRDAAENELAEIEQVLSEYVARDQGDQRPLNARIRAELDRLVTREAQVTRERERLSTALHALCIGLTLGADRGQVVTNARAALRGVEAPIVPSELDEGVAYAWAHQALRHLDGSGAEPHLQQRALDSVMSAIREAWAHRGRTTLDEKPAAQEPVTGPAFKAPTQAEVETIMERLKDPAFRAAFNGPMPATVGCPRYPALCRCLLPCVVKL